MSADATSEGLHTYEVFLKRDGKDEFRHAGALDASDDELALVMARESYLRRAEGDRLWLIRRDHIVVADDGFIAPNRDKPHRHHDGQAVAARRKAQRASDGDAQRASDGDAQRAPDGDAREGSA